MTTTHPPAQQNSYCFFFFFFLKGKYVSLFKQCGRSNQWADYLANSHKVKCLLKWKHCLWRDHTTTSTTTA